MSSTTTSHNAAYGTVAVGAAAVLIRAGNPQRRSVVVQNVHATQVLYVGDDSSVTTAAGLRLNASESIRIDDYNGPVYGIASGAATDVRYFEVG